MAHWAELDEDNIVIRVLVGSNDDPDEGYQWLIDNLGGTWLKCSYNTKNGEHILGGTPFRHNFPGPEFVYVESIDSFLPPKPFESWIVDEENKTWKPPFEKPDSGIWKWDEETVSWKESSAS